MKLKIDNSWTLFLDRDGVINERIFGGYIQKKEDFIFLNEADKAIGDLSKRFARIIVVTNQQGVGKGLMSERNLSEIHEYMCSEVEKLGGKIDHVFSATNLRGESDDRRKPSSRMALEAKELFPEIDFTKSIMVGDTDSDILFGKKNGMKTVLIRSKEEVSQEADLLIDKLEDLKEYIV